MRTAVWEVGLPGGSQLRRSLLPVCAAPQGFLLGVHHSLASLRNSLSFVQREEAREGLRVLTIEVALLRWLEKKLAQVVLSLGDFCF